MTDCPVYGIIHLMKVLFLSSGLKAKYGGPSISESSLACELRQHCSVTVLCPDDRLDHNFAKDKGLADVISFSAHEAVDAWLSNGHWLARAIAASDIVHINGHWRWENHFIARLSNKFAVPVILHPRGMCLVGHRKIWVKKIFNIFLGNFVVERASRIVVLSKFEKRHFASYRVNEQQFAVCPNAVVSSQDGLGCCGEGKRPVSNDYFLYLGRLESRKNLLFLLEAFAKYRRAGGSAALVCVGPVERGYDNKLLKRSLELGVQSDLKIMESVYDARKWDYMHGALAVVYPAVEEPFGRVPFEAVAAGVYPIIPDESGSAEYLGTYLNESIYRHQDVTDLEDRFHFFEKRGQKGESLDMAKVWVETQLNWQRIGERVFALYQEVCTGAVQRGD